MRFIITSTVDPEKPQAEETFDPAVFTAYMRFNEELHNAGVLVASEGLLPGTGARIVTSGGRRKVVDGPFAESKELVGGFYIIEVPSLEEAKAWALKCPLGMASADVLEVRRLTGSEDLPAEILDLAAKAAPNWTKTFAPKR